MFLSLGLATQFYTFFKFISHDTPFFTYINISFHSLSPCQAYNQSNQTNMRVNKDVWPPVWHLFTPQQQGNLHIIWWRHGESPHPEVNVRHRFLSVVVKRLSAGCRCFNFANSAVGVREVTMGEECKRVKLYYTSVASTSSVRIWCSCPNYSQNHWPEKDSEAEHFHIWM